MSRFYVRLDRLILPALSARVTALAIAALLLGYVVFVSREANITPAGADSSGYFNLARLLLEGDVHVPPRTVEGMPMAEMPYFTYAPLGFVPDVKAGHITPTYPLGLPLLVAASSTVAGWTWGPHLLMLLHVLAGIALVYWLARISGCSRAIGGLVAAALALSPLYLAYSLQAMSDLPAMVWCTLALCLATRGNGWSALGCGAAFGLAVLIRPTNALLALPLLIALGRPNRRWLWVLLGGAPMAVLMVLFNQAAYGSVFRTGYGDVGEFFGSKWAGPSAAHYIRWLPVVLTPLFLTWLAAPWHRSLSRRLLWTHILWMVLLPVFYLFYYFTHREWWYLRFLLPMFPSLLVLSGLGAEALTTRVSRPATRRALWFGAAAIIGFNANARWHSFDLRNIGQSGARFTQMRRLVAERVPANAILLAHETSGALYFATPLCIVRWDALDNAWPRLREGAARAHRPIYAALFTFEDEKKFRERTPGTWSKVEQRGLATLWRLEPQG